MFDIAHVSLQPSGSAVVTDRTGIVLATMPLADDTLYQLRGDQRGWFRYWRSMGRLVLGNRVSAPT